MDLLLDFRENNYFVFGFRADEVGSVADGGLVLGGVGVLISFGPSAAATDQTIPESRLPSLWCAKVRDRDFGSSDSAHVVHPLPSVIGHHATNCSLRLDLRAWRRKHVFWKRVPDRLGNAKPLRHG